MYYEFPGYEDYDQHYKAANQLKTIPEYHFDSVEKTLLIRDPIWDECKIGDWPGDEVFIELFTNPLIQRLAGIEQLTLPKHFATMPGTYEFTRFEHAWGSVVFTRKMIERARENNISIGEREALIYQLRTFLSDVGHTAYSHLGDWLFQGFGGKEDQHDDELMEILEVGGVNDILKSHEIDPEEVVFPNIQDWIECKSPDLCVDRIDFGAREIMRWVTKYEPSEEWLSRFSLDAHGRIVMPNHTEAKYFALRYGLLATEHWGQPAHRMQLQLFAELVRSVIVEDGVQHAGGEILYHPRDILYTIDSRINSATRKVGELTYDMYSVMLDLARAQRKIFSHGRDFELQRFHEPYSDPHLYHEIDGKPTFPHPLEQRTWATRYTGIKPNQLQFIDVESKEEVTDFDSLPHTFDIFLPSLKERYIDPLFIDENGKTVRLSEADDDYKRLMDEQIAVQTQAYVARWYGDPAFIAQIKEKIEISRQSWANRLKYERADSSKMKNLFRSVGMLAVGERSMRMTYR